jgi:hypothetical protein
VAQLSTLGIIMRTTHFKRIALIVVWQATMLTGALYYDRFPNLSNAFIAAALSLPFLGYIAALYDAPLFAKWSRGSKGMVLTVLSLVLTIAGYVALFLTGIMIKGGWHDA